MALKGKNFKCETCGKKHYRMPCHQKKSHFYCSHKCANKALIKKDAKIELRCKFCGASYERYKSGLKNRVSNYCSKLCQDKAAELVVGSLSKSWKGGKYQQLKLLRTSAKWRKWREQVFERDKYTCQLCGNRSSKNNYVEIHPHHIMEFAKFKDLRFEVNNGLCLCVSCHKEVHKRNNSLLKDLQETYKYRLNFIT